jgi:hypothetical protein
MRDYPCNGYTIGNRGGSFAAAAAQSAFRCRFAAMPVRLFGSFGTPKDTQSGRNAGRRVDLVVLPRPPHATHAAARSGHFAGDAEAE